LNLYGELQPKNSLTCYGCWVGDLTIRSPKIDFKMESFATILVVAVLECFLGHNGLGFLELDKNYNTLQELFYIATYHKEMQYSTLQWYY
jgi:hypothetical protein